MKTVFITGAGSGFGKGVALGLARMGGYKVYASCQIWPQVWEMEQLALKEGLQDRLKIMKLDIHNNIDKRHAFETVKDIDVLFNNAGILESGSLLEIPMEALIANFATNVFAGLEIIKGFGAKMVQQRRGKIVWTSSIAGLIPGPDTGSYVGTKHAIEGLACTLREELKPYGVQVCTVNPGTFLTGFNDTGVQSQFQWWDDVPHNADTPIWNPNPQSNPQEMIDGIINVIVEEHPKYRTVLPLKDIPEIKASQASEWELRV